MKIHLFRLEKLVKPGADWSEPDRALQSLVRRQPYRMLTVSDGNYRQPG